MRYSLSVSTYEHDNHIKTAGGKGGVVVLPIKEYERLKEQAIPTYISQERKLSLDKLVAQGLKDYKAGVQTLNC